MRRRRRRSGGRLNYDDYLGETQLNFSQINECNLIRIGSNYPATLLYKDELLVNRGTGKKTFPSDCTCSLHIGSAGN